MLVGLCVFRGLVPDTGHAIAGEPIVTAWVQPDDGAALCAHQVLRGDAHRPAVAAGLADDLVGGVHRRRPADLRDGLHLGTGAEEFHADGCRAQAQQAVEVGDDGFAVERRQVGR